MTHYKATRPDGTDFYSGTIDYAAALASGEIVTHPGDTTLTGAASYLSVSTSPSDCTGFRWPCRLFEVEPIDPWIPEADDLPNKRACTSLRVVAELPAWQAFGPNGERVVAIIERAKRLTSEEINSMDAAWDAAWDLSWDAARGAAWDVAWYAALGAARDAALGAARDAAWDAARDLAWDAALAELVRDLIAPEQYDIIAVPWNTVIGENA